MADFVKLTTAIKLQFWKDTIFFLFIVYRQSYVRCWFLGRTRFVRCWYAVGSIAMGYRMFSFECREIHISFLDSLHIRRIAILIICLFVSKS
jgi:hypothetical protein